MSTSIIGSRIDWSGTRDAEGHREYKVEKLIKASDSEDGPAMVLQTPGLYLPGAVWEEGNDFDPWAWCRWTSEAKRYSPKGGEKGYFWTVEQIFTNKPLPFNMQRCNDFQVDDPLLEPQKVSGSFVKMSKEATHDRFGKPIVNSSFEQIRGEKVEFDENNPTIIIEQNVPFLQFSLFAPMVDTVNDRTLWGVGNRQIKLSNASWEKKYYGYCCPYYTRRFEFEIDTDGFDRNILDEGTKVLRGKWNNVTGAWDLQQIAGADPDRFNPTHFMKAEDRHGNPISVILDGLGKPWTPDVLPTPAYVDDGTLRERAQTPPDVDTSGLSGPPVVSVVATSGGSLTVGRTYIWNVTAVSGAGETIASNSVSLTIAGANNKASLSWAAITDATSYRVYREHAAGKKLIAEVKAPNSRPGNIFVQKYDESNFLLLGIPVIF